MRRRKEEGGPGCDECEPFLGSFWASLVFLAQRSAGRKADTFLPRTPYPKNTSTEGIELPCRLLFFEEENSSTRWI